MPTPASTAAGVEVMDNWGIDMATHMENVEGGHMSMMMRKMNTQFLYGSRKKVCTVCPQLFALKCLPSTNTKERSGTRLRSSGLGTGVTSSSSGLRLSCRTWSGPAFSSRISSFGCT
jgi:hypothetical protein